MTSGFFLVGIPLLAVTAAVVGWIVLTRPALPPRFTGYTLWDRWYVDPVAVLDRDLKEDRLASSILAVRYRLLAEIAVREARSDRGPIATRAPPDPAIARARRLVRDLGPVYLLAAQYEDPARTDPWSRWRKPRWRAESRRRFDALLARVETVWSVRGDRA